MIFIVISSPGWMDGARNMEESLWMLNKEYQEGVRHVILTPHFRYDMFEPHMNIVTRQVHAAA